MHSRARGQELRPPRSSCNDLGVPTRDSTVDNVTCTCDTTKMHGNAEQPIHLDAASNCSTCLTGYGPAPKTSTLDPETPFACAFQMSETNCKMGTNWDQRLDVKKLFLNSTNPLIKIRRDSTPTQVNCDCTDLNNKIQSSSPDLMPGNFAGASCNECPPEYGGMFCNIPRSACNNKGRPSNAAITKTNPQCVCDVLPGETASRYKGGACESCNDGHYGANCDLNPWLHCGSITTKDTDGVTRHVFPEPGPNGTANNPMCQCGRLLNGKVVDSTYYSSMEEATTMQNDVAWNGMLINKSRCKPKAAYPEPMAHFHHMARDPWIRSMINFGCGPGGGETTVRGSRGCSCAAGWTKPNINGACTNQYPMYFQGEISSVSGYGYTFDRTNAHKNGGTYRR